MSYTTNARGFYLDDRHTHINETVLGGAASFIIADAGSGESPSRLFPNHVQTAYNLKIPIIARFGSDPELYGQGGLDPARFPAPDVDWQIKALDKSLKNGSGVMRIVHGVMIDASKYLQTDGKTKLTSNWVAGIGQHLMDMVWNRYKKPVYLFILESTIKQYAGEASQVIPTWLAGQPSLCVWLSAYLNDVSFQVIASPPVLPVPSDSYNPFSTIMYAPKWDFSRYAYTKFGLQAVTDDNGNNPAVPLFISSKTQAGLYSELNYTPSSTPVTPPPISGGSGDTPTDLTPVLQKLDTLQADVTTIKADVAAIRSHFR